MGGSGNESVMGFCKPGIRLYIRPTHVVELEHGSSVHFPAHRNDEVSPWSIRRGKNLKTVYSPLGR